MGNEMEASSAPQRPGSLLSGWRRVAYPARIRRSPPDGDLCVCHADRGGVGSAGHGLMSALGIRTVDTEWLLTNANPLASIALAISGDVDAIVVPRGMAVPASTHGPSPAGRLAPLGSVVKPYISGVWVDWKIYSVTASRPSRRTDL
jgi:hypothetical protein